METIRASVNSRLLTKASRLFTGTLAGRIIEILQNARRAGASMVEITNKNGEVTVQDNGQGIADFRKLLDLGGSGWEEAFEQSEDPAGVGLFCLAPRAVCIRSLGGVACIAGDGWTGAPVTIRPAPEPIHGTRLQFQDEPWNLATVEPLAVFTGMDVTVDGQACAKKPFVSEQAAHYPELGCRIEVREVHALEPWQEREFLIRERTTPPSRSRACALVRIVRRTRVYSARTSGMGFDAISGASGRSGSASRSRPCLRPALP